MNKLTAKEVLVVQMALTTMIEDNEAVLANDQYPFTPQARKELKEIADTAKTAKAKIAAASGHEVQLDAYVPGDEKDFLTKES